MLHSLLSRLRTGTSTPEPKTNRALASCSTSSAGPRHHRCRGWTTAFLAALLFLIHGFSRRASYVAREDGGGSYDSDDDEGFFRWRHPHRRHRRHHAAGASSEPSGRVDTAGAAASESLTSKQGGTGIISSRINGEPNHVFLPQVDQLITEGGVGAATAAGASAAASSYRWSDDKPATTGGLYSSSRRVKLQVFVEALCVDSKHFVLEELVPAYQLLTRNAVDLELVVFGNAHLLGDDDDNKPWRVRSAGLYASQRAKGITCQHGPAECDANSYEQCAIHLSMQQQLQQQDEDEPEHDQHDGDDPAVRSLAYVACLFTDLDMGYRQEPFDPQLFASCARSSFKDDPTTAAFRIRACHDDPALSSTLQREAATATPKDHTHVPWILINGKHMCDFFDEADDDDDRSGGPSYMKLVQAICRAYEASAGSSSSPLPPACT
jgi:Gamma interferon inducible lysosomal thiol reductase (GILT)